jgi:hypothetical protein
VCFKCKKGCGPVFFFIKTINCDRYVQIILGQLFSELTEEERLWLVSARLSYCPYCTHVYAGFVDIFGDRIISSDIWPAFSPDLNPCNFFFWGCLKDKVYSNNPRMEEELKGNICREISNIPVERLQKVNQNLFHLL